MSRNQRDSEGMFAVRDAVLGDGVVVNRTSSGGFVIHSVIDGTPRELGSFDTIAEAWNAIDQLDTEWIAPAYADAA